MALMGTFWKARSHLGDECGTFDPLNGVRKRQSWGAQSHAAQHSQSPAEEGTTDHRAC